MKNLFILTSLFTLLSFTAMAQNTVRVETNDGLAYQEGDKIFLAGISFGYYGYGFVGSRSVNVPPINAALEFGIHENFSVGPYIGYASWGYNWTNTYDYNWSFLSVGARGSFHYVPLVNEALDLNLDEEKLDFYVTLIIGLEFQSFDGDAFGGYNYANDTDFIFGPVLGFKYKFNDKIGAYFEGGRGAFGYGTIGVAVHF